MEEDQVDSTSTQELSATLRCYRSEKTVIDIGNTKDESALEKLCVMYQSKVGGKLVISKEILQLDSALNIKISPYKEVEEVTFDEFTTFNINTT